ncbi:MAG: branched-chain amino acid ABC transporter permease [Paracoccaceae bacterium]|nr:branched-chain amino acid ABC transporter permease [Paracoccaceae bacterium]
MWANIDLLIQVPKLAAGLFLEGLLIGAVFSLIAYGLALVWGVMNVKNLAQGPFVIAGGYICWYLSTLGLHPVLGMFAAAVVMWGLSWICFKLVVSKVLELDMFVSLLATFGLAYVLEQSLSLAFTQDTQTINLGWGSLDVFGDGLVLLAWQKVMAFAICCVLAVVLVLFMKRSRMGQAIRATAQNARAARVMGIDTDKVYSFTFCLNGAICGAAGALVAMIWVIQPFYGITYSIRAFVLVVAAGLGNLPGVILAGLGMGGLEQFGGFIIGAEYQQALVVGMLLAVLVVRLLQQSRKRQAVA